MLDKVSRKAQIIVIAGFGIIIFFGGIKYQQTRLHNIELGTAVTIEQTKGSSEEREPGVIAVHVVGAVEKPGVYTLEKGKRIDDAVRLAVPLAKADLTQINLAAPLQDGKQVYVPLKGEKAVPAAASSRIGAKGSGLVNINTAGTGELEKLPGIGPALAGRIIDFREKNGPFGNVEDITKVSGIGPALLAKIKDKITVE
mgnify:CR=1 FL=1